MLGLAAEEKNEPDHVVALGLHVQMCDQAWH